MSTNTLRLFARPELKTYREKVCTQEEMMGMLEVQLDRKFPRSTYTHKENGTYSLSTEEAIAISRILKVNVEKLFVKKEVSTDQLEEENGTEPGQSES